MEPSSSEVELIDRLWRNGDGTNAGRHICQKLSSQELVAWAINAMRFAVRISCVQQAEVTQLLKIADDIASRSEAKQVFKKLRHSVLKFESLSSPTNEQTKQFTVLLMAENVAKVVYNSTGPSDEFDEDASWWVAGCLKDLCAQIGDEHLTREALALLIGDIRRQ
jgi:hypothetical protein